MKKIIIPAIIILVILIVWYLYPKNYTETFDGVYYQLGNDEVSEEVKMHLDGTLQNYITDKKTFEGTVEFEGKGIPKLPENRSELIMYYESGFPGIITSLYQLGEDGGIDPDMYYYGNVYINDNFTQFTITVHTRNGEHGSWSGEDGFMITAPAQSREEALQISDELMEDYRRDGDTFIYNYKEQ